VASLLDSSIPQPAPGSHWTPARKVVSFLALNVGYASSGTQPSFADWMGRILQRGAWTRAQVVQVPAGEPPAVEAQAPVAAVPLTPSPLPHPIFGAIPPEGQGNG
jgi:hypothetical protein